MARVKSEVRDVKSINIRYVHQVHNFHWFNENLANNYTASGDEDKPETKQDSGTTKSVSEPKSKLFLIKMKFARRDFERYLGT